MIGQRQRERLQKEKRRSGGLRTRHHGIQPRPPQGIQLDTCDGLDVISYGAPLIYGIPQDGTCPLVSQLQPDISLVPLVGAIIHDIDTSQRGGYSDAVQSYFPTNPSAMFSDIDSHLLPNSTECGDVLSVELGVVHNLIEDVEPTDEFLTLGPLNIPFMDIVMPDEPQHLSSILFMGLNLPHYHSSPQQRLLEPPPTNLTHLNSNDYQSEDSQDSVTLHADCYKSNADDWKGLLHDRKPALEVMIAATSKFMNWCRLHPGSYGPPLCPIPDMYSNYIHCVQTSTMLAYLHNATSIDLSIKDLLELKSPFYRPNTTMADDTTSLLSAARKPWIPAHLQPTLPQILFPHHPYLDLIPFPTLRARVITLTNTTPWMLNPMELKKDIFSEGLSCRPDTCRTSLQGSGQPWDVHSWQAAPWFITKWRLLMASPGIIS